jgi:hypothetical protein
MKKLVVIVALLSCSPAALAATNYLGPIMKVGTRGNGTIFIELNQAVGLPQCSQNQVEIPASQASARDILAVALAAYHGGMRIYIQTDGCLGIYPTMSGHDSWIYSVPS